MIVLKNKIRIVSDSNWNKLVIDLETRKFIICIKGSMHDFEGSIDDYDEIIVDSNVVYKKRLFK